MATSKKQPRYIGLTSNVTFKFGLDPDIYNSVISPILGIGNTVLEANKIIDTTIKQATKNGHCVLVKATVQKGSGATAETRQVDLICDADNADTAPLELIGKNVKIGYKSAAVDWEIINAFIK